MKKLIKALRIATYPVSTEEGAFLILWFAIFMPLIMLAFHRLGWAVDKAILQWVALASLLMTCVSLISMGVGNQFRAYRNMSNFRAFIDLTALFGIIWLVVLISMIIAGVLNV